jgi:hypothetical protein
VFNYAKEELYNKSLKASYKFFEVDVCLVQLQVSKQFTFV